MNKLNYSSNAALIAAFDAGVKFAVYSADGMTMFPVTKITRANPGIRVQCAAGVYRASNHNGTLSATGMRLGLIETKFPFSNFACLMAAFENGVKFQVYDRNEVVDVTNITSGPRGGVRVHYGHKFYAQFRADGSNPCGAKLEVAGTLSSLSSALAVTPSKVETPKAGKLLYPTLQAAPAPTTPEPFLKRFLGGQAFYVPKTGEVLHEVTFKKDELVVTLKNPQTGALRTTPRYNHEGKHKYRPERSLVAGTPPKPKKAVKIKVYKHAYNGSLFVIREGEVIPNIRGILDATMVGETTINE